MAPKSPLAHVTAPETIPTPAKGVPAITTAPKTSAPSVGEFMDRFTTEHHITFNYYRICEWNPATSKYEFKDGDVEADVRAKAGSITAALREQFPNLEVTEVVESAKYKPPFQVSWDIHEKGVTRD